MGNWYVDILCHKFVPNSTNPLKEVDFLIVGQGIAGSLLAHELIKRDRSVVIFDQTARPHSSSHIAAGLYNPITGRKMVKTWMADELFPVIAPYYQRLEAELRASFHRSMSIYRPFISTEEQNDWQGKAGSDIYHAFIRQIHTQSMGNQQVIDPYGGLELNYTGVIDLPVALSSFKEYFQNKGMYQDEVFQYRELMEADDYVTYGRWRASAVVFCEGTGVQQNPFFKELKMRPVKGEVIDVKTEFVTNHIVNRGVFIIPRAEATFRVGSTYDNRDLSWQPTEAGSSMIKEKLEKIFRGSYEITGRRAGVRPATFDRRPFVGLLENRRGIGIFNGLGTKGVSLAPFFAPMMADFLLGRGDILPAADVNR